MIEFQDIHKCFGTQVVLDGVSLTVERGQALYIIGKSGAGKSVLVKHLVGLIKPDRGVIRFEGQDITGWRERDFYPLRRRCALVFQHSTLFDALTLQQNVALPLRKHRKLGPAEANRLALDYLAQVQMETQAHQYPAAIGDGLRKRVAIARALTLEPEYLIFDEPTTGLDPVSALRVDRLIRRLSDDLGVTSLVVSHDLRSIFGVADRVVMLYEGKVRLDGVPEAFRTSADPVVAQFVNARPDGPMEL